MKKILRRLAIKVFIWTNPKLDDYQEIVDGYFVADHPYPEWASRKYQEPVKWAVVAEEKANEET